MPRTARTSVSYATAFIGFFYLLTFILGFGAMVLVGQPAIRAIDAGGNMAAPLLAQAVGGDAFLGFISAVAFATILAVVAGLTLAGAATLSHDLWVNVMRHGEASDAEQLRVARVSTLALGVLAIVLGIVFQRTERCLHGRTRVRDCRERQFSRRSSCRCSGGRFTTRAAQLSMLVGTASSLVLIYSVADDSDRRAEERLGVVSAAQSRTDLDSRVVCHRHAGVAAMAGARGRGAIRRGGAADPWSDQPGAGGYSDPVTRQREAE